jgi:hypothetical protein
MARHTERRNSVIFYSSSLVKRRKRTNEAIIIFLSLSLSMLACFCLMILIIRHWDVVLLFLQNSFLGILITSVILTLTIQGGTVLIVRLSEKIWSLSMIRKLSEKSWLLFKGFFAVFSLVIVPLRLIFRYGIRFKSITFSSYLKYYFPEEVVAEVIALHKRLVDDKKPGWLIRVKILRQLTTLIWAFYFQIKIDNLRSHFNNQNIDDN